MVELAAHRGGGGLAPENTLGAFRSAHATFGGPWLEMDVRLAADGVLVVVHDHTLDRTTSCTGPVAGRTSAELAACDATVAWPGWNPEGVPTFADVVREGAGDGWRLLVEIKNIPGQPDFDPAGTTASRRLMDEIDDAGFPLERLVVISFWAPTLDEVRRISPAVRTGYLSVPVLPGGGPGLSLADNVATCVSHGFAFASPEHTTPDVSAEGVGAAHTEDVGVWVWTANTPEEIAAALAAGVDGLTSDRPDRTFAAVHGSR